jgi:hypothetical protein
MLQFREVQELLLERRDIKDQIKALLDRVEDDRELELVKNALMKKYLKSKMDEFEKFSWYEGGAKTLVDNLIYTSKADVTAKFAFVEAMLDGKAKFTGEVFTSPGYRSLYRLVPGRIRTNPVFREMLPHIMKYSEQAASGVGKGELFLLMFGANSQKPSSRGAGAKGDVIIDGWSIEVKDSGGEIHAGKEGGLQKASAVFDFNRGLLKDAAKEGFKTSWKNSKGKTIKADPEQFRFYKAKGSTAATEGGDWFWRYLTNDIPGSKKKLNPSTAKKFVGDYMQKVYITMNRKDAVRIGNSVYSALGNQAKFEETITKYLQVWVFNSYKAVEKFDSLVVLDMRKGMFANIIDGENIPRQVTFKAPAISKGKSTYAVPAGAMGIKLK